jgi:hypothetical protein
MLGALGKAANSTICWRPSAVAQHAAEAKAVGDETLHRIADLSLDTSSEVAALAVMEEQERGQIERAVAGGGRGEPERTSDDAIVLDVRVQSFRVGSRPSDTGAANKVNKTIQCRADLSAKENVGSWPAHCELPPSGGSRSGTRSTWRNVGGCPPGAP